MMAPSTPPQQTLDYTTRQRQRQDIPYRDDPNAPPRLESYTLGGLGPLHALPEKTKRLPVSRRLWNATTASCCSNSRSSSVTDPAYYIDTFNDMPWSCSAGTTDEHGIWLNRADPAGTIMAATVWILTGYSAMTMTWLAATAGIPVSLAVLYTVLTCLALACHIKTSLTDPGAIPASAVPTAAQRHQQDKLSMCSQCQTFKPAASHHCRICNRCISRMDHHCPWMNNCIGATNMKHFILFLVYTWMCSIILLLTTGWNYFFCVTEQCVFTAVLTQLVRVMTVLAVAAFLFTSSMLMNVVYGIMTGIGTIDRLKKKNDNMEESIPVAHIFGIDPWYWWWLPVDPHFPDFDLVVGYATPQRLLREQMLVQDGRAVNNNNNNWSPPRYGMAV